MSGFTAVAGNAPEVTGVFEDDGGFAESGMAKEGERMGGGGRLGAREGGEQKGQEGGEKAAASHRWTSISEKRAWQFVGAEGWDGYCPRPVATGRLR
jgi:hypothetical protein